MQAAIVFPHQLFERNPALVGLSKAYLVEDPLFFKQYRFHAQKIVLHRASMKAYAASLIRDGFEVRYVESALLERTEDLGKILHKDKVRAVRFVDPTDDWLERRLLSGLEKFKIAGEKLADPCFLTDDDFAQSWFSSRQKFFFTDFYIQQRKRLGILIDDDRKPVGGKWSFDTENRKKLPKGTKLQPLPSYAQNKFVEEAIEYTKNEFPGNYGSAADFDFPIDHKQARKALSNFLDRRFASFGEYEDAIVQNESFLFHSVLTPALNIGLLSPREVVDEALKRIDDVPMNSLEGFIRQVIGWREFIRQMYRFRGRQQRLGNFWNHTRKLSSRWYTGELGIEPVDCSIRRVVEHSYTHHIERLMILGNFMLLTEVDPNEVYRWFMELFIDAYDWVMVPNVYGMSQFADGGLMTTKPYLSGSSYVLKMSDYKKGDWSPIWDALYWRFIDRHRDFFSSNPRMSVMVSQLNRMGSKLTEHHRVAERFLSRLD